MNATYIISIVSAIMSSGVIWSVLQWFMQKRQRKLQGIKDEAEAQKADLDAKKAREDREELLAEAQSTAQRTALESANERYLNLQRDYTDMRLNMRELRQSTALLIDAFEGFLVRMKPTEAGDGYSAIVQTAEVDIARATIIKAREHLF